MELNYLVTGGAGFIGCALAAELLRTADDASQVSIAAVDCLHPQVHRTRSRPPALPQSASLNVMDINDARAWDEFLAAKRPQTVVHLAAETGTGQSLDLPTRHTHVNVTGTAQMLEAFDRSGHIPGHIILASSRAVYGEGYWVDPADGCEFAAGNRSVEQLRQAQFAIIAPSGAPARPLPHDHSRMFPMPSSVYGSTKLAQEQILALWCAARGVPLSVLRLQNVYGAGQSPDNPYTGIVGLFHQLAASKASIPVYEDGAIGRDFIYIDDVARCLAAAIAKPPMVKRVIDVGSGKAMTILEAAQAIAAFYDAPDPHITGAFRHGDIRWAVAAPGQLERELGERAAISFGEGTERLAEWLRGRKR